MTVRIGIRGFLGKELRFSSDLDMPENALGQLLPELAEKHSAAMAEGSLDMIEIEFLDEPDETQRYFRIGTNPASMVLPVRVL